MELVRPEAHTGSTPGLPYDRYRYKECDAPFSDSTLVAKHRAHSLLQPIDRARCVTSLLLAADLARLNAIFRTFSFLISWGLGKQGTGGIGIYGEFDIVPNLLRARGLRSERAWQLLKGDLTFGVVGVTLCRAGQRTPLLAPSVPAVRGLTHAL